MLIAPQEGKRVPISQMRLNSRCAYNRIVWSRVTVKCETDCQCGSQQQKTVQLDTNTTRASRSTCTPRKHYVRLTILMQHAADNV